MKDYLFLVRMGADFDSIYRCYGENEDLAEAKLLSHLHRLYQGEWFGLMQLRVTRLNKIPYRVAEGVHLVYNVGCEVSRKGDSSEQ